MWKVALIGLVSFVAAASAYYCPPREPSWGQWSSYGPCTVSCGVGYHTRDRFCEAAKQCANCRGRDCLCDGKNSDWQTERCINPASPAVWGSWTSYGSCDVTCGNGHRTRTRTCKPSGPCPDCSGADCLCNGRHEETQTDTCSMPCCKQEPYWDQWSSYGPCSVTCGTGHRTRDRTCLQADVCPSCRGSHCFCDGKHNDWQSERCHNPTNSPVLTQWSSWSKCPSRPVGSYGTHAYDAHRTRTRECLPGGPCPDCDNKATKCDCNGAALSETEACKAPAVICANFAINNERDDLEIRATYNLPTHSAADALWGNGRNSFWLGDDNDEWAALLKNDCCGLYTVEFECFNAREVVISGRQYGSTVFNPIRKISVPEGHESEWRPSGTTVVDDERPEPRDCEELKLTVHGYNAYSPPKLRNVKIVLCCEQESHSKRGHSSDEDSSERQVAGGCRKQQRYNHVW